MICLYCLPEGKRDHGYTVSQSSINVLLEKEKKKEIICTHRHGHMYPSKVKVKEFLLSHLLKLWVLWFIFLYIRRWLAYHVVSIVINIYSSSLNLAAQVFLEASKHN